jgi:hypothetical protein
MEAREVLARSSIIPQAKTATSSVRLSSCLVTWVYTYVNSYMLLGLGIGIGIGFGVCLHGSAWVNAWMLLKSFAPMYCNIVNEKRPMGVGGKGVGASF